MTFRLPTGIRSTVTTGRYYSTGRRSCTGRPRCHVGSMIAEMCGRYSLSVPAEALAALFRFAMSEPLKSRFNIAPTQLAPVVRLDDDDQRSLALLRWGLVPRWAKDLSIGSRLINARSETVDEKPSFRDAYRRRRCLIPASGFFEWKKLPSGTKQPYFIHPAGDEPIAMAGLWERWGGTDASDPSETFTVLTTSANGTLQGLHDRMPVIIAPADFDRWLNPSNDAGVLLRPAADDLLAMHPVSTRVNSPKRDDPSLVEPISDGEPDEPSVT